MFQKINKKIKENFWYFLLYDILFFFILFLFFIFVRLKLQSYQFLIQQFGPTLNAFTAENLDPLVLQQTLEQVNAIANRALLFIYIAVPIGIFLIWVIFQGSSWQLLSGKKRFDFRYLVRFAAISLPFFILLGLVISKLFGLVSELFIDFNVLFGFELWFYIVFLLLLFYLMLASYSDLNHRTIFKTLKIAFKKIHLMFPVAFVYLLVFFILFVVLSYLFIVFFSGIYTSGIITGIILFLLFLILFIYSRIFLFGFFSKSIEKGH